ncbi:MAG: hypothetical protein UR12_C0026G0022 [candidate division TM6 bacterium GW2011_GWF2_30_66]|nr:MAG: hypothetical protein UR12_C0026G0022 [candidate division TM6 bacterium GW2011_GWF2_30_66]
MPTNKPFTTPLDLPIKLIDTHCHINIMVKEKFDTLIAQESFELASQIAQEASQAGIKYILNVGTSIIECENCINLAKKNKNMFAAVGIHPCDITSNWKQDLEKIKKFLSNKIQNKIVCIGECGLDLYHRQDTLDKQIDLLKAQIELSLEQNLPLSIHMRQSTDQMHKLLDQYKNDNLKGVMHCFPEGKEFADSVISLGLLIGVGGSVTYPKNTILQETVAQLPIEKIILETDAPFLPPQIIRGKQNHPKYILAIAEHIAKIKNITLETVAEQTTKNALNLFKFY